MRLPVRGLQALAPWPHVLSRSAYHSFYQFLPCLSLRYIYAYRRRGIKYGDDVDFPPTAQEQRMVELLTKLGELRRRMEAPRRLSWTTPIIWWGWEKMRGSIRGAIMVERAR